MWIFINDPICWINIFSLYVNNAIRIWTSLFLINSHLFVYWWKINAIFTWSVFLSIIHALFINLRLWNWKVLLINIYCLILMIWQITTSLLIIEIILIWLSVILVVSNQFLTVSSNGLILDGSFMSITKSAMCLSMTVWGFFNPIVSHLVIIHLCRQRFWNTTFS